MRSAEEQKYITGCLIWNHRLIKGLCLGHNAEEPYVFHNAQYIESAYIPGVSEKLQDEMCGAWVSFAYTGDPNHEGLSEWPPVKPDELPTMAVLDRKSEARTDHDKELINTIVDIPLGGFPGPKNMIAIFGIEPS